jgi:hypothetical protein
MARLERNVCPRIMIGYKLTRLNPEALGHNPYEYWGSRPIPKLESHTHLNGILISCERTLHLYSCNFRASKDTHKTNEITYVL